MWSPDIHVRYASFPISVRGVTLPCDDGSFDVYVNDLLPEEQQIEVVQHECDHIRRDHFYDDIRPVSVLEAEANAHPGERKHPARPAAPLPEPVQEQKREKLPDIFGECPPDAIPIFSGLEFMRDYIKAFLQQRREERKG